MKTLVFFLLLLTAGATTSKAQFYNFSHSSGTYTPVTAGTPLLGGKFIDTIAAGFDINIGGIKNDTLFIMRNGSMALPNGTPFYFFAADLLNGIQTYKITGSAGSRVLVIEFAQTKFGHDMTTADYINFQVWLYEADNAIEIRFGSNSINNPDWSYYYQNGGAGIGYVKTYLKGAAATPLADTAAGTFLTGTPPAGKVYRFEPTGPYVNGAQLSKTNVEVYPNPGNGLLTIAHKLENTQMTVRVYDVRMQLLAQQEIHAPVSTLDLSGYTTGIYQIVVDNNAGARTCISYLKL